MAILKLHGAKFATCTRRVATVLHELQVPFELVEVNLRSGEHKTPAYLKMQPFGQIPYIDDAGFILYQTRAICRYIAAKHPGRIQAYTDRAAAAEVSNFDPSAMEHGRVGVLSTILGTTPDQAVVDKEFEALDKKLEAYETILAKHRYVAGETITLADLFHLPLAWYVTLGGSEIMTRRPNVARWYNELVTRPSWLAYLDGVKTTEAY
ncbi:thioredoxin-like protein [Mycena filopes]|nr:thioredoxin-like protein [Mycena filopes]